MQDLSGFSKNLTKAKEQIQSKQLFLFDMNNTLLNIDKIDWYSYRSPLMQEFGINITYQDYLKYAGSRRELILQRLYKDKTGKSLSKEKVKELAQLGREFKTNVVLSEDFSQMVQLLPGVKEFLKWAKEQGKLMVVVTSTTRYYTPKLLKAAGILEFFDAIVTADDVSCGKPCPEPFEKGAESVGLHANESVAFEDSFPGIKSAKSAGAFVIGVLTPGNNDKAVQNADAVITDYRQLLV